MIARVAKEDCDGNFSIPVLEAFPGLEEAYLEVVEFPMDLRTIMEDRIHLYENIKQLQDDLKIMLENCCNFNGVETDLGQYAMYVCYGNKILYNSDPTDTAFLFVYTLRNIWNQLNEMFAEVCDELGVQLGRWRP